MRAFFLAACLGLAGCSFQGSGLAPFNPAPAAVAEQDLDVPYVPTPRRVVEAMLDMAGVGPEDYLIDLGSGDGRIAIMAAQRGARALGVDIDPDRIAEASLGAQAAGVAERARFRRQDLFDTPLREASVITMYLLPEVNLRLRPRLLTEARPGTRIVSHNFTLGDWQPDAQRELDASRVYFWIVPAVAAGEWLMEMPDGSSARLVLEQRFQQVSGSLDGRALRDARLSGRRLRFTVDEPDGARTFHALVEDAAIVADPEAPAAAPRGWRARRAG
jgi:SAM-dependent methyltransferase